MMCEILSYLRDACDYIIIDCGLKHELLTMYQSRPQLCKSVRSSVNEIYGEAFHVFERPTEHTIKVAECPAAGMSILDYAPKNPAAESYRSLAREVMRLGEAEYGRIAQKPHGVYETGVRACHER